MARKPDYSDVIAAPWRVVGILKADSVCIFCGKIPVIAGIAKAYADHIVALHNAYLEKQNERT